MNLYPNKRSLAVIKDLGSKWCVGATTMNAALVICVFSNFKEELNEFIITAITFWGLGAVAALIGGYNIIDIYLCHYSSQKNIENMQINDIQARTNILYFISVLNLILGMGTFFYGIVQEGVWLAIGIGVVEICCVGIMILGYRIWVRKKVDCVFAPIILIVVAIICYLVEGIVRCLLPAILEKYESVEAVIIFFQR